MPFVKVNIKEEIEERKKDLEFAKAYEAVEAEFNLIESVVKMRKELGITQPEIAKETGLTQQMVSRIEKVGHSPSLRNFLRYLSGIGLEIEIKKKVQEEDKSLAV